MDCAFIEWWGQEEECELTVPLLSGGVRRLHCVNNVRPKQTCKMFYYHAILGGNKLSIENPA